jgi:hypothetical protein
MKLRGIISFAAAASLAALTAGPAWAGYHLFGSATYVSPGESSNRAVTLTSDANANTQVYSGIDFDVPSGLTINDLKTLQTDYKFTASACGQGSPRFAISLADHPNEYIFVYFGANGDWNNCGSTDWTSTGNLLDGNNLVEADQLGGTYSEKWSDVQTQFSGEIVSDIFLVSDSGPNGSQTVEIDNTNVNAAQYNYEFDNKNDCKAGGWQNFIYPPGPFATQGACVSYFANLQ